MSEEKNGDEGETISLNITHGRIFKRFWAPILGTLTLILVSSSLWLIQPFLLGRAIDGLVQDEWRGVVLLAGLQIGVLSIGAMRRYYDTRVYTRIYRTIGGEAVSASQAAGVELTRVSARANMLREVVNFFEFRVPATLRSVVDLVGSLALLAFLSTNVFYACAGAMGVIILVSLVFSGRLFKLNSRLNNQLEKEIDVFESRSPERTDGHLSEVARWRVRASDTEVIMFGLSSLTLMLVMFYALYDTVSVQDALIGEVFAVITYVGRFQFAVNTFPGAYQQLIRTLEITRRINQINVSSKAGERKLAETVQALREIGEAKTRLRDFL